MTDLLAVLARVLGRDVDDLDPDPPWDEPLEARMSHVAETWDDETRTCQPLREVPAYEDLYAEPDPDEEQA